jgi:hypothetical protein
MSATATYLDAAGKPRLRNSVSGFIDVLGFSHLSTAARTIEESQQLLQQVADAIRESRSLVRSISANHPLVDPSHWAVKFFSDNLVFGFPADGDAHEQQQAAQFAIHCVQHYQLHMALSGFFVRGGVTLGPICLTDEIIFGSSLIESYILESKSSIVPRVILTTDLQKLLVDSAQTVRMEIENAICRDIDGWWFINYLQAAYGPTGINWELIERHKASVLVSLKTTTAHDVLPKFGWSCRYHNVFCHWHRDDPGFNDRYRIDRVDEQSTIHLLKDIAGGSE